MMQRGEFKAIQMEISVKIITKMFYIHVSPDFQTASLDEYLHRGASIFQLLTQWMFPWSAVDGSCGPDSDIRLHDGLIPHVIGPFEPLTHWQAWKIMVMMNKSLSDRGGASQSLHPTLPHEGLTSWCSFVDTLLERPRYEYY